jgi:hypothetical protein
MGLFTMEGALSKYKQITVIVLRGRRKSEFGVNILSVTELWTKGDICKYFIPYLPANSAFLWAYPYSH